MNLGWLDLLLIVLLLGSTAAGALRGLVRELLGLLGLLIGLVVAFGYHGQLALALHGVLGTSRAVRALSFLILVGAIWAIAEVAGLLVAKTLELGGVRWLDRVVGGLFGLARGFVVVGALLLLAETYVPGLRDPAERSRLAPPAVKAARAVGTLVWREVDTRELLKTGRGG